MDDAAEKRRAVPKFGSFKPQSSQRTEDSDGPRVKRLKARRHEERPRSSHAHRSRTHRSLEPPRQAAESPREEEESTKGQGKNELFAFDTKGDPLNLKYGCPSKVSTGSPFDNGRIMGSEGFYVSHPVGSKEEFSIASESSRRGAMTHQRPLIALRVSKTSHRRTGQPRRHPRLDDKEDFIPLSSKQPGTEHPRDLGRVRDTRLFDDSSSDSDSGASTASSASIKSPRPDVPEMADVRKKAIELTRRIEDEPGDIAARLALIGMQNHLMQGEKEQQEAPQTAEEAKALAEVKLGYYEKALIHANSPADREAVLSGIMREGAKVWGPGVSAQKWDKLERTEGLSFGLWRDRLNFEMTNDATYSFEKVRDLLQERLRLLQQRLSGAEADPKSAKTRARTAEELCYVFLRLTRYVLEAGYTELAIAAWQGVLELAFSLPAAQEEYVESIKDTLISYWDTEQPRLGEPGAKGWIYHRAHPEEKPEIKSDCPIQIAETTPDRYMAWWNAERQAAAASRLPARDMDEGVGDDPCRVVLGSDLEPWLIFFRKDVLEDARRYLVDAWLVFCGLPTAIGSSPVLEMCRDDPFLSGRSSTLAADIAKAHTATAVMPTAASPTRKPVFRQHGARMALSPDTLFAGPEWFPYALGWKEMFAEDETQVDPEWAMRILDFLVMEGAMWELADYYLAVRWLNSAGETDGPRAMRKLARRLLKKYGTNLKLWNAYGLIKALEGDADAAREILSEAGKDEMVSGVNPHPGFLTASWPLLA